MLFQIGTGLFLAWRWSAAPQGAHSADHERSNRSIMNTESGDHEHAPAVS